MKIKLIKPWTIHKGVTKPKGAILDVLDSKGQELIDKKIAKQYVDAFKPIREKMDALKEAIDPHGRLFDKKEKLTKDD